MGKWEAYLAALPKLPVDYGHDSDYQVRVEERKKTIDARGAADLARATKIVRAKIDTIEDERKVLNLELEALRQLTLKAYEDEGIRKVTIVDMTTGEVIGSLGMQPEPYASVKNRADVREWAMENGLEEQLTLPWQTLNSISKTRLEQGLKPIPGVELFIKEGFVLRKQ